MCAIPINPPSPTSYPHPRPPTTPLTHPRSGFVVSNHTSPGRDLQPHHPWSRLIVSSHTPPQVRTHRLQPHRPRPGLAISNHTNPGQDSSSPTIPTQVRTHRLQRSELFARLLCTPPSQLRLALAGRRQGSNAGASSQSLHAGSHLKIKDSI